jgi:hypothetical protein
MQGIKTLKAVWTDLLTIDLPPLRRQVIPPSDPKNQELVNWGICLFVYSLIAHLQKILAGLVQLAEMENLAASAPVSRHVFEWAAVSCYLSSRLSKAVKVRDWEAAWSLLSQITIASRWVRKFGHKYEPDPSTRASWETAKPIHIPHAVDEYEAYQAQHLGEPEALESYGFLCDHAHANAVCLARYYEYDENGAVVRFVDPDKGSGQPSFLSFVNRCLIDLLLFLYELLGLANESVVRAKVHGTLKLLAQSAPKNLTKLIPP